VLHVTLTQVLSIHSFQQQKEESFSIFIVTLLLKLSENVVMLVLEPPGSHSSI